MKPNQSPILSAIAAMAKNRVIGKNNQLPWHLPADLQHFKAITTGHPILMGRKTYESIGRPLPNRTNIILTRDLEYKAPGCEVIHGIDALSPYTKKPSAVFVIGGAEIYQQLLPYIQKLYLTVVDGEFEGDAFFPELDLNEWHQESSEQHEKDDANAFSYSFVLYSRI